MGQLSFTTAEVEALLDGRYNSFRQDIADSTHTVGSPQAISAATEYLVTIDAVTRNVVTAPAYITDRWDATNNKIAVGDELDAPVYVADLSMTFDPTVAAAGLATVRLYIDDSGTQTFATDPVIRTYTIDYKAAPEGINILATWYLGSEAGYDAKNDGVYFTFEAEAAGELYGKGAVIYRT